MNLRTMRRTRPRRWTGPVDDLFGEPIDWNAHHRWYRKAKRHLKRRDRRTPRPLPRRWKPPQTVIGRQLAASAWERRLADPRTWPREMR